jgi:hypothetical protein
MTVTEINKRLIQVKRSRARLKGVMPRLKKLVKRQRRRELTKKAREQLVDLTKTLKQLKE